MLRTVNFGALLGYTESDACVDDIVVYYGLAVMF
jgi:hypothetical protein